MPVCQNTSEREIEMIRRALANKIFLSIFEIQNPKKNY